jgi:hypothetical protein
VLIQLASVAPIYPDGSQILPAPITATVANGIISYAGNAGVPLCPNDTATPANTSYLVTYFTGNPAAKTYQAVWIVPTATTVTTTQITVTSPPGQSFAVLLGQLVTTGCANGQALIITNLAVACGTINPGAGSETVAYAATLTLNNSIPKSYTLLTGNVTSLVLANSSTDGAQKQMTFCQDGSGNHTVAAPANFEGWNGLPANLLPNTCSTVITTFYSSVGKWLVTQIPIWNR